MPPHYPHPTPNTPTNPKTHNTRPPNRGPDPSCVCVWVDSEEAAARRRPLSPPNEEPPPPPPHHTPRKKPRAGPGSLAPLAFEACTAAAAAAAAATTPAAKRSTFSCSVPLRSLEPHGPRPHSGAPFAADCRLGTSRSSSRMRRGPQLG